MVRVKPEDPDENCFNLSYGNEYAVQVQLTSPDMKPSCKDEHIFFFINTGSFNLTSSNPFGSASNLKDKIKDMIDNIAPNVPTNGSLNTINTSSNKCYILPTTDDQYLGYHKAIKDGGSSYSHDSSWNSISKVPSNWNVSGPAQGDSVNVRNLKNATIIILTANGNQYNDPSVTTGLSNQPKTKYLENFDELVDASTGSTISTWGQANASNIAGGYSDGGLKIHVVSLSNYSADTNSDSGTHGRLKDQAFILHALAAYTGEMIPDSKYGVPTSFPVSSYLSSSSAPAGTINPYDGTQTPGGVNTSGLFNKIGGASGTIRFTYLLNNRLTGIDTGQQSPVSKNIADSLSACGLPAKDASGDCG